MDTRYEDDFNAMHPDETPPLSLPRTPPLLSAGVIVIRRSAGQYRYLLLRAFNYWDFPKGVVEDGETPLACALREVAEETTITDLQFHWGNIYCETPPYNQGRKVARYYIAETTTVDVQLLANPLLGKPEHSEYRWVDRRRAWDLLTPRVRAVLLWSDGVLGLRNNE